MTLQKRHADADTLAKDGKSYVGEAEGMENERSRVELAARATLRALVGEPVLRPLDLEAAVEIHLVGLDDAGCRILQRPHHAGQNS